MTFLVKIKLLSLILFFLFPPFSLQNYNYAIYNRMPSEIPQVHQKENLIVSQRLLNKNDCFLICNQDSYCAIVYYHDNECILYNSTQYTNLALLASPFFSLYYKSVNLE
jgi:hypothetical protein